MRLSIESTKIGVEEREYSHDFKDGVIFMELGILKTVIETFSRCEECFSPVSFSVVDISKQGFANKLVLTCIKRCSWSHSFYSSSVAASSSTNTKNIHGEKRFTINTRSEIGIGCEAINTFSTLLNMPSSLSNFSCNEVNNVIHSCYKGSSEESIRKATLEVRKTINANASKKRFSTLTY